jgi:hypothetical protein
VPNLKTRLGRIGWTADLWEKEQKRRKQARLQQDRERGDKALRAAEERMQDNDVTTDDDIEAILSQPPLRGPGGMTTQYELITPEAALDLIAATPDTPQDDGTLLQRKQGRERVTVLTEAFRRGEYVTTHQGIAINGKGQVVDGLHRLKSAFDAEEALLTLVTRDLPEAAMPVIDIGKARSNSDWFTMTGERNGSHLAALLKVIYLVENVPDQTRWDRYPSLTKVQLQQVKEDVDAKLMKDPFAPDPREAVRQGGRLRMLRGGGRTNPTGGAAAWYLIREVNPAPVTVEEYDPVDDFFHRLQTGINLPDRDPILALRNWLDPDAQKRRRSSESAKRRPPHLLHLYLLLKAWESWVKGEKKAGVAYASDFVIPQPIVYTEVR